MNSHISRRVSIDCQKSWCLNAISSPLLARFSRRYMSFFRFSYGAKYIFKKK